MRDTRETVESPLAIPAESPFLLKWPEMEERFGRGESQFASVGSCLPAAGKRQRGPHDGCTCGNGGSCRVACGS